MRRPPPPGKFRSAASGYGVLIKEWSRNSTLQA